MKILSDRKIIYYLLLAGGIIATSLSYAFLKSVDIQSSLTNGTEKKSSEQSLSIVSFITPHHLAAKEFMHKIFHDVSDAVGGDSIDRVILISPNHFNIGKSWVIGSEKSWETPFGMLYADAGMSSHLKDGVFFGQDIFEREHGIRNILPFVKEYFPQAAVVPLALRDGFSDEGVDALAQRLAQLSSPHTILIVSADFSHYLDWNFSRFHDAKAKEILSRMDMDHIGLLDVDCASCLRVAMQYSRIRHADHFQFVSRSSSLELAGSNRVGEETSHITGYFSSQLSQSDDALDTTRLLFSGQVTPQAMTESARRMFMGQDFNIFEQDGSIVSNVFDDTSYNSSLHVLQNYSLMDDKELSSARIIHGKRFVFVDADMRISDDASAQRVLNEVSEAKQHSDFVVALWSKDKQSRGSMGNADAQRKQAHDLIDAGADVVIGLRAQNFEPIEIYNNKAIFSSLGYNASQCRLYNRMCAGVQLGIGFSSDAIEYVLMPIMKQKDGQIVLAKSPERDIILKKLSDTRISNSMKQSLQEGMFTLHK